MSVAVKIWVEKLDYRSIEIPTSRKPHHQRKGESEESFLARRRSQGATVSKRLTFAHREALKVLADHARHNGLTWPGMATIAKELGVKERQAFRIVADLELAELVKIHEGGGRGHSNHYWVRVPWVQEPERVVDLPLLGNKQYPPGARLKCDPSGKAAGIDVDYYVRMATLKTLSPVTGFIASEGETLSPDAPFKPETLTPVTPFSSETLSPVTGESPSLRESPSLFEPPSIARAAREKNGDQDEDRDRAAEHVQPSLPRFGALPAPEDSTPPNRLVYTAIRPPRVVGDTGCTPPPARRIGASPAERLADGQRIWGAARDLLFRPPGVERDLEIRLRNTGTVDYDPADGVLILDGELLAEDLEPGSVLAVAVADAARRRLEVRLVGGPAPPRGTLGADQTSSQTSDVTAESIDGSKAARARLAEKLSADELARLDELERQRLAYTAQEAMPAGVDAELVGTGAADTEGVEPPRRRRKKEPAVA